MDEGWLGDDYLIIFEKSEALAATERYQLKDIFPGYTVVGLRGWDDLIVSDPCGVTYTVPTVPISTEYLSPFPIPGNPHLKPDDRLAGKIKWHIKPLIFGGDANAKENLAWVDREQHATLVAWWNKKYIEFKKRTGA